MAGALDNLAVSDGPRLPSQDGPNEIVVDWLEWGIRLANELHRLPQNASRRQRRLLAALCTRVEADAGSTSVFVIGESSSTRLLSDGMPPEGPPTLRRVYFVGHDLAATPFHPTDVQPVRRAEAGDGVAGVTLTLGAAVAMGIDPAAAPKVWLSSADGDAVLRSLVRLAPDRLSLLELRRRPIAGTPVGFEASVPSVVHAVHRACAWACDASPLLGTPSVPGLSPRERETLEHLLAGASEKEVATLLGRSPHTIHSYVKRIYRQLGVSSRAELLAIFVDASGRADGEKR